MHVIYVQLEVDGQWHFFIPQIKFPPYGIDNHYIGSPPTGYIVIGGEAVIWIYDIKTDLTDIFVERDWQDIPDEVWEPCFIGHIDASLTSILDMKAPRPNPPKFTTDPFVYFKLVKPYDPGEFPSWEPGPYNEGDIRSSGSDWYQAKQNIVDENTSPQNNPAEWLWISPHFEMRIKSEIGYCEDYEGSNPVRYKMVGVDDAPSSDWTMVRCGYYSPDVWVKDLPLPSPIALADGPTSNPSGTQTKIYISGTVTADDRIEFKHTALNNGMWNVVSVGNDGGGNYLIIDKGWYQEEIFYDGVYNATRTYNENEYVASGLYIYRSKVNDNLDNTPSSHQTEWEKICGKGSGCDIAYAALYNWSDIYTEDDWEADEVKNYQFKAQTKDNASPQNESRLSPAVDVIEPETYPAEML
jgi:hypothetical protein